MSAAENQQINSTTTLGRRLTTVAGFIVLLGVAVLYDLSLPMQNNFTHFLTSNVKQNLSEGSLLAYGNALIAVVLWALHTIAKPLVIFGAFLVVEVLLLGPPKNWSVTFFALKVQVLITIFLIVTAPVLNQVLPNALWFGPLIQIDKSSLPGVLAVGAPVILALASILLFNFAQYWVHRAQHKFPILWRFHLTCP